MALVLFVSIFLTATVAGVMIRYLWNALGLVPSPGKRGGRAPSGYTVDLNGIFTLIFLSQLYVARFKRD